MCSDHSSASQAVRSSCVENSFLRKSQANAVGSSDGSARADGRCKACGAMTNPPKMTLMEPRSPNVW